MSDEIRPALTPDEWARGEAVPVSAHWRSLTVKIGPDHEGIPSVSIEEWTEDFGEDEEQRVDLRRPALPAVIAFANAARDDNDPGKLTHAHLRLVRAAADLYEDEYGGGWPVGHPEREPGAVLFDQFAAALAALLPPPER